MNNDTLLFLVLFASEIAALHVFFAWIDRRWPPRPAVDVSHLDDATRARIARRANRLGTFACLVAWPLAFAAWGFGFYRLQSATMPEIPGALYMVAPTAAIHLVPGVFASIVLAGPLGMGVMRLAYRRRFHEVMAIGDSHFQFDVRLWMYATFVWIVPLCVDAETLFLGRCVVFTPQGIHSRGLWSREMRFHPYREVAQLEAVDGQKLINHRPFPDRRSLIRFKDGTEVPSPRFAYHDGRPDDFEALKYTSRQSGIPIRWVPEFD